MIYSGKTLILSAILFLLSALTLGAMYLPVVDGHNGFDAMEATFNSLRKGISPPFEELTAANKKNLGKNIIADLTFSDIKITRAATRILLRNKLMVTPKGRTLNVQGDLGYTLQFFISDIRLLYFNKSVELEKKYSMPATQSMFVVDRILKKLAISLASQKMTTQENLTKKIRSEVLVPAYNLRNAPPISETSGITYLALGTFSLLLIATLWDLANLLFFRTITDHSFLRKISGAEKREKLAAAKQKAALKKKVAKKPADPKKATDSKKAAESQMKSAPKPGKPKSAPTKSAKKVADSNNAVKKPRPTADKQVERQKKVTPARKAAAASPKKAAPATNGKPPKKTVNKAVAQKRTSPEASQKPNKKVTNPAEKNKSAVKAAPAKPKAKPEAPTKAPAPKAVKVKK